MKEGALIITPDTKAKAHPFLASTDIDLVGPVTATLKVRAKSGGESTITWRTKTASFTPEQNAPFDWPTSADWQEVKVELPETNRLIHLRITPPRSGTGLEIQSIELRARKGEPRVWHFTETK